MKNLNMKSKKRIEVKLNTIEQGFINDITKKTGYTYAEILRMGLRAIYRQEFLRAGRPKNIKTSSDWEDEQEKEHKISPEDYCKNILNGQIVERDGRQCCEYQIGVCTLTDPLDILKY